MVKLGIVAWYEWNKSYVSTVLCENRDKPQMKCCGKCYLAKQLKKAEDGSSKEQGKNLPTKWDKIEEVAFIVPQILSFNNFQPSEEQVFHSNYIPPAGHDPLSAIFHPPSAC